MTDVMSRNEQLTDPARLDAVAWMVQCTGGPSQSFDRITRMVGALVDLPLAAFSLVERDRQLVKSAFGMEMTETSAEEGAFCRACVAKGDLLVVPDAARDPRFSGSPLVAGPPHIRFYAGMPVRSPDGRLVGTLCVVDLQPGEFSPRQVAVLTDMRDSLEEVLLLRTLAVQDRLTGLYNRGYFDELLAREWRTARRDATELSLLMVDVDHFKAFNDRFGHPAGDICLRAVAAVVADEFRRPGDVVSRFGGEEFSVLLPRTSEDDAAMLARRAVERVASMQIPNGESALEQVTISAGIASRKPVAGEEHVSLVEAADKALYAAKAAGRNTVALSSQLPIQGR